MFEVRAAADILGADGNIVTKAGTVVAEIKTDKNGSAETPVLALGKYNIREKTAPSGYVRSSGVKTVELKYAGQTIDVADTAKAEFKNDLQQVNIHLKKIMERDEGYDVGNEEDRKNVAFGLYAAEKLTAADGSFIPDDGLIFITYVDENMTSAFEGNIPFGKYYIRELSTDEKYVLNGEKYIVSFEYKGQEVTTVDIDCGTFKNRLKRGSVEGIKVDEHDKPLEGAEFGLFKTSQKSFKADYALQTAVSDKDGKFGFKDIPYGKYIVTEIKAPDGYVFSDTKYSVNISEDKQIIKLRAVNNSFPLKISKKDVYGREIVGAKMQIKDSTGKIIDEWTSDGTEHIVSALTSGKYTLHETASPAGYVLAADIVFTIDKDNNVEVEKTDALTVDENGNATITMIDDVTKVVISKYDITGEKEISGASLKIYDSEGIIVDEWVSTEEAHKIEGKLIAGRSYTLHEEIAPDGYVIANDVTFTVSSDGSIDKVVMKDETTKVHITKTDITGEKEIAGASLKLFDSEDILVDEWVSTTEAHKIEGKLTAGKTYTLHEEIAPDGYVVANDITFTVSYDGSIDKITMKDDVTKVYVTKTDITGEKEIAGASLKLYDSEGILVDEWVSTTEAHKIEGKLIAGRSYTLHEEIAPDGYVIANDVLFTVSSDGSIDKVVMKDETTKAQISKRDITTDEELPGAKLVILDENGNVVEEWVSTDIPHIIEGKLIAGKEYTLREITAPDGYETAQDIKFTMNTDGSVTEVVMYDESKPDVPDIPDIPETPSSPGTPEKPGKPSTPSTPSKPSTPSTPTTPEKPSVPEQPSTPERTVTKVTTANQRTGSDAANIAFVGMIIACAVMVISAANKKKYDEK